MNKLLNLGFMDRVYSARSTANSSRRSISTAMGPDIFELTSNNSSSTKFVDLELSLSDAKPAQASTRNAAFKTFMND